MVMEVTGAAGADAGEGADAAGAGAAACACTPEAPQAHHPAHTHAARPGGAPRRGIFRLDTTRGDRLFMTHLGTAFIFLGWLAFYGTPLYGAVILALIWAFVVFYWA